MSVSVSVSVCARVSLSLCVCVRACVCLCVCVFCGLLSFRFTRTVLIRTPRLRFTQEFLENTWAEIRASSGSATFYMFL